MCYHQELDKKQTTDKKIWIITFLLGGKNVCVRISLTPQVPDITSLISYINKCLNNKTSVIEVGKCSVIYAIMN